MEPPTVREVIKRLEAEGWCWTSCCGDHRKFKKNGRMVIVSGKLGEHVPQGTYKAICRLAGW